jgi:hypothetical protein
VEYIQRSGAKSTAYENGLGKVNGHCFLALDDFPKGIKMNGQSFSDVVFEEARRAVIAITKKSGIE